MARLWWLFIFVLVFVGKTIAAPITDDAIPDPLKQWVPWVLHGLESSQCPFNYQRFDNKQCHWAGTTSLDLTASGGVFSQQWKVDYPQWVALPGRHDQWPQDVEVDGAAQPVVAKNKQPHIYLETGEHHVTGYYKGWSELPQTFKLPLDVGLVLLTIDGESRTFPRIDQQGNLWLRENAKAQDKKQQDTVSIIVNRKMLDAIPISIETRIQLNVAGNERELLLQGALLDNFIPMQLVSKLPARLETDGQLRVQVKAGQWVITVLERAPDNVLEFTLPQSTPPWPIQEVWAFEAQTQLRQVTLSGATAIDPKNTRVPSSWHKWPTYQMQADTQLVLTEKQRGDSSQRLDQLNLQRTWWLDFDGGGFSLQDHISGSVYGRYRLPMNADITLGRVSVNGEDQFITRLEGESKQGVELRQGRLNLIADSRWQDTSDLPATGWDADFQRVSAQLNLPPGWRLLAATGVDESSGSWIAAWDLLDWFLIFIIAASFLHLWGKKWGGVALIAMVLMYHEQGAPIVVWLNVLAASALLKVLPTGRFKSWIQRYFYLSLLAIVLIGLPFMVQQVRQGLYPQLEHRNYVAQYSQMDMVEQQPVYEREISSMDMDGLGAVGSMAPSLSKSKMAAKRPLSAYDPNTKVQTGPGLPNWNWSSSRLEFNGPVDKDQIINLWLLSPMENRLLAFTRVALLVLLLICVSGWRRSIDLKSLKSMLPFTLVIMMVTSGILPTPALADTLPDVPDDTILEQLQQRLLQAPDCVPNCADSAAMQVIVSDDQLLIRQHIDVAESVLVPLPGQRGHWSPQQVIVDGEQATNLHHDKRGHLWINLDQGSHDVVVQGDLPAQAVVQLILPIKPHQLTIKQGDNWEIQGNTKSGQVTDLVLKRRQLQVEQAGEQQVLTPTSLPAFLKVERRLYFGQQWQLQTVVTRLTPADSLVQVAIPLLDGEVVTQSGLTVKDGMMPVHLQQGQKQYQWSSILPETTKLTLQAQVVDEWVEHWSLEWSPIWHIDWQDLPLIVNEQQGQINWRPWPGEQLTLMVQRPSGEAGQTLTMDQSEIKVNLGQRSSDITLQVRLRSSLGQQHTIKLPAGAQLTSVIQDGKPIALELIDGDLNLPIHPGQQKFIIVWRQTTPIKFWFDTPVVGIGLAGVNHKIDLSIPSDRWILAVGGPTLGPAVLLWGVLFVLILVAIVLGRVPLTPLKPLHWALLLMGLTQASMITLLIVVGWLLALGWRSDRPITESRLGFNFLQIALAILTLVALSSLFFAIKQGLLGQPDMQIAGNGSYHNYLHWYQDRTSELLPQAWVVSVPLFVYRTIMLLWALWLAFALLSWLRWGWQCFSQDGIWRHVSLKIPKKGLGKSFGIKTKEKDES